MCFVRFMIESLAFFSMSIALMLYWRNLISSTAYTCTSTDYLDHRHCGKTLSATTILDSVEILPFILCFCNISIIYHDTMDIITPVCPLQSGSSAKDVSSHHLMTLKLTSLSMSGRFRVPLMYLSTITRFPQ